MRRMDQNIHPSVYTMLDRYIAVPVESEGHVTRESYITRERRNMTALLETPGIDLDAVIDIGPVG